MRQITIFLGLIGLAACATVGSTGGDGSRMADRFMQADANGDSVVSRAEAPSRLDFDAADADGDGVLTLSEVETFTRGLR